MELLTTRFGTIVIDEADILTFPEGLIGLPFARQFVLVQSGESGVFRWLQSVDEPSFALLLADPWELTPDYEVELSDEDVAFLDLDEETPKFVYVTVTIPPGKSHAMTINLLAPLVMNACTRQGRQVILNDERYDTRHPVLAEMWRTLQQTETAG
jgi:flagellar assembly factor FliW